MASDFDKKTQEGSFNFFKWLLPSWFFKEDDDLTEELPESSYADRRSASNSPAAVGKEEEIRGEEYAAEPVVAKLARKRAPFTEGAKPPVETPLVEASPTLEASLPKKFPKTREESVVVAPAVVEYRKDVVAPLATKPAKKRVRFAEDAKPPVETPLVEVLPTIEASSQEAASLDAAKEVRVGDVALVDLDKPVTTATVPTKKDPEANHIDLMEELGLNIYPRVTDTYMKYGLINLTTMGFDEDTAKEMVKKLNDSGVAICAVKWNHSNPDNYGIQIAMPQEKFFAFHGERELREVVPAVSEKAQEGRSKEVAAMKAAIAEKGEEASFEDKAAIGRLSSWMKCDNKEGPAIAVGKKGEESYVQRITRERQELFSKSADGDRGSR